MCGSRGWGDGGPDPLKITKLHGSLGIPLRTPWKITKLLSQHSMLGHRPASETPKMLIRFKQGIMCLAQGHNAVTTLRLEPAAFWSLVKHSTIEPLRPLC